MIRCDAIDADPSFLRAARRDAHADRRRWLRRAAVAAGMVLVVIMALPWIVRAFEPFLVYFPEKAMGETPADHGLTFDDVYLKTEDGETLNAWWIPGTGRATVLYLHGNGGNVSHRAGKAAFLHRAGASLFLLDYRGYGRSTGSPSEDGLALDALAAYRYLSEERGVSPGSLIAWGESLGGAVAARLASERACAGLVLESAFTSARDMAPRVAPWLPFATRFMRSRFDTLGAARAVTVPKLVIHGADDPVTPFEMGETLYEQVSEPKRFLAVPGAQHTDTWLRGDRDYLESVREFIDRSVP